jgi:hypothetical protein
MEKCWSSLNRCGKLIRTGQRLPSPIYHVCCTAGLRLSVRELESPLALASLGANAVGVRGNPVLLGNGASREQRSRGDRLRPFRYPEQSHSSTTIIFDVGYDLSRVAFIAPANAINIPPALDGVQETPTTGID